MAGPAIDDDVRRFIEETEAFSAEQGEGASISAQRAAYDRMCDAFRAPRPPSVMVTDDLAPGFAGPIPIRRYRPRDPMGETSIVYYHGGGFVLGGLDSHDDVCAELCARLRRPVTAVDYRLSPEHAHPAAFEDALAAARAEGGRGPVLLMGDSVGGNLAAAVDLAARGANWAPVGTVLIYPALGGDLIGCPAYAEHAQAPLLAAADLTIYRRLRAGGPPPTDDASFSPLVAKDVSGLGPCRALAVEIDPLRDDPIAWAHRLTSEAGIDARCQVFEGLVHGCLRARHSTTRGARFFDAVVAEAAVLAGRGDHAADWAVAAGDARGPELRAP